MVAVGIIAAANSVQKKYKNSMQVIHGEPRKKSGNRWKKHEHFS